MTEPGHRRRRFSRDSIIALAALTFSGIVSAAEVGFNSTLLTLDSGESKLVAIVVRDVPVSGLAAFQVRLEFDASIINILDPNRDYVSTGVDPFAPLGGHALCETVRGTSTCDDPDWQLSANGRNPILADASLDNSTGVVSIAYGTIGNTTPPSGGGVIAVIEVRAVADNAVEGTINMDVILATAEEPPASIPLDLVEVLPVELGSTQNAPVLDPIGPKTVFEGQTLSVPLRATDADGDAIRLSAPDLPQFGSLSDNGDGTGVLEFVPGFSESGFYTINLSATDNGSPVLTAAIFFTLDVVEVPDNEPPLVAITLPATGSSFAEGVNIEFAGTASDPEDGNLTEEALWSSSIDGPFGTGGSALFSPSVGVHVISLSATDGSGATDTDTIVVTVEPNQPPVVAIVTPPDGSLFTQGDTVGFVGTASDPEDGDVTASAVWTSGLDGLLGTGGSIDVPLGVGIHRITLSATDSLGATGTETITLIVEPRPRSSFLLRIIRAVKEKQQADRE